MKHCLLHSFVVMLLLFSSCNRQENKLITYPFQEDRALVGVCSPDGKMAYFIIDAQNEVVSYIHLLNIQIDTIYRDGKLAFLHIPTGQKGYFDIDGREVWLNNQSSEIQETSQEQQVVVEHQNPVVINTNDWHEVIEQSPFYEESKKTFAEGLEETDVANRRLILDYVEQLRQSYTTKDINFIEQVFSERALIITGKVIRTGADEGNLYLPQEQVVYNIRSKAQYVERLKQVFQANRKIDLKFSEFKIRRHPTIPTIYGVSLRQAYTTDIYSDDGYLFLLWDFADAEAPQIHVRTWQPRLLDNHTVIPENEIFSLRNFNLK